MLKKRVISINSKKNKTKEIDPAETQYLDKYDEIKKKIEDIVMHNIKGEEAEFISDLLNIIKQFQEEVKQLREQQIILSKDVERIDEKLDREDNLISEKVEDFKKAYENEISAVKNEIEEIKTSLSELKMDTEKNKNFVDSTKTVLFEWIGKAIIVTAATALISFILKTVFGL